MFGEITANEIELLNAFHLLGMTGQKELKDYLRYLLCKQYRREVMVSIFQNQLIHNLFHSIMHMIEKDDYDIAQLTRRLKQIQELYFGIYEQVHNKYSEQIEYLDSIEIVKDFGKNSFENINRALLTGNTILIRIEIIDFYEGFKKLSTNKDARKIVAV
ncbi:MAG TPA: hypothetical protein DER33_09700 [Syntrophomonas sp.]|jgi:hypothetical protein|nr:hypothetical protein [Syntrophomonas sp.]HCF71837.1 hypothetical protein [Syntrophomonas sp.]